MDIYIGEFNNIYNAKVLQGQTFLFRINFAFHIRKKSM